jgi:SAM-dependent methyltransferase
MGILNNFITEQQLVCPSCRGALSTGGRGLTCLGCARRYPRVAGLVDLRLASDRYLDLEAERARAERLHELEPATDVLGLAEAYYALTAGVDPRRDRFLRHIAGAEARGEALAERLPRGGRILEVGCGSGGLLVAASRAGATITGVDVAARWLVVARRRLADHGLDVGLIAAAAERLPWPDGWFDAVVADSVLEHLDTPARALDEWVRVLRPGGRLVVWSPNRFVLATDPHLGVWGLGWLPRAWVPAYLRLRGRRGWPPRTLSPFEARRLALAVGLEAIELDVPSVSERWAGTLTRPQRLALRAYTAARRLRGARGLLRAVGPLWELRARTRAAA